MENISVGHNKKGRSEKEFMANTVMLDKKGEPNDFSPSFQLDLQNSSKKNEGVKLDKSSGGEETDRPPVAASQSEPASTPTQADPAQLSKNVNDQIAQLKADKEKLIALSQKRAELRLSMVTHSDKVPKEKYQSLLTELESSENPEAVYQKFVDVALGSQEKETSQNIGSAVQVGTDLKAKGVLNTTGANLMHYANLKNGASKSQQKKISELMKKEYDIQLANNELFHEHKSLDTAFRHYQTLMYGRVDRSVQLQQDSQFVDATANVLNKMLRMSYMEKPMRYAMITRDKIVDDFKEVQDFQGGGVFPLAEIGAQGQVPQVKLDTEVAKGQAEQRGAQVDLLRKDLINDDIGILARVPESLGRSTRHHDENLCASLLLQNRKRLGSSDKIFSAANANIAGASGALVDPSDNGNMKVLNRETLRLMTKKLADQKFGDQHLFLGADYLIGGTQYQAAFQQLFERYSADTVSNTNAFAGSLKGYIVDPRLNAATDIFWAASSEAETFKMLRVANMGFGEGYFGPQLIVPNTERLSLCFQLVYDVGAYIVDHRALAVGNADEPAQLGSLVS